MTTLWDSITTPVSKHTYQIQNKRNSQFCNQSIEFYTIKLEPTIWNGTFSTGLHIIDYGLAINSNCKNLKTKYLLIYLYTKARFKVFWHCIGKAKSIDFAFVSSQLRKLYLIIHITAFSQTLVSMYCSKLSLWSQTLSLDFKT